jgi:hypothetical protein
LRKGRGIDDGGCDIFGSSQGGRDGDLRKNSLDSVADEGIFYQGSDKTRLTTTLVTADAYSDGGH